MTQWDSLSLRKPSGGLNNSVNSRHKKALEKGGFPANARIAKNTRRKGVRTLGGNKKIKQLYAAQVFVSDSKTGLTTAAALLTVKTNSADRQFARQNILTRGALVEVELNGVSRLVRITSRPGQSGTVFGVPVSPETESAVMTEKSSAKQRKTREKASKAASKKE